MDPETQQPESTPPAPTTPETPPAPTAEATPPQIPDVTPEESPESVNEPVQEATTEPAPVAPVAPVTPPPERVYTQSDRAKSLARKLEKKKQYSLHSLSSHGNLMNSPCNKSKQHSR